LVPLVVVVAVVVVLGIVGAATTHHRTARPTGSTVASAGHYAPTAGAVVFTSQFGAGQGWQTGTIAGNAIVALSPAGYHVTAWAKIHHLFLTPYTTTHSGISVAVGATTYPTTGVSVGAGCQSDGLTPPLVYQMVVYPAGNWYLEEGRVPGSIKTLRTGTTTALGSSATIEITCVVTSSSSSGQTTQIVGFVNGQQVVAAGNRIGQPFVSGYIPVLMVGTYGTQKSTATFTGITVRKVSPASG